ACRAAAACSAALRAAALAAAALCAAALAAATCCWCWRSPWRTRSWSKTATGLRPLPAAGRAVCASACRLIVVVYASALADAGEELDGRVAAAAEMAVARVSVPAAAIVIARERLVDMNEGRGIRRAKREPLIARAAARSTSTSDATIRALGEARQASVR